MSILTSEKKHLYILEVDQKDIFIQNCRLWVQMVMSDLSYIQIIYQFLQFLTFYMHFFIHFHSLMFFPMRSNQCKLWVDEIKTQYFNIFPFFPFLSFFLCLFSALLSPVRLNRRRAVKPTMNRWDVPAIFLFYSLIRRAARGLGFFFFFHLLSCLFCL